MTGLLTGLGSNISTDNSVLDPAQSLEYIGLVFDTLSMNFTLQEEESWSEPVVPRGSLS